MNLPKRLDRSSTIAIMSFFLFAASLIFPCYYLKGEVPNWIPFSDNAIGLLLLLIGWIGLFTFEFAWLANPLWAIACIGIVRSRKSPITRGEAAGISLTSCFAVAFSLSFLLQRTTYCGNGPAGTASEIGGYLPGYYLWVSSMVTLLFARPKVSENTEKPASHDSELHDLPKSR